MRFSQPTPDSQETDRIKTALQQHMTTYGYEIFELPVIEPADLFLIKAGDQIIHKLFTFERHNQEFALRPEFTAAAAYRYITTCQTDIVRWQFSGHIFEDDPNSAAPYYQHFSMGAELIGMSGSAAEAEIISMAAHGLLQHGFSDIQITIGHSGLMRQLLQRFGLDNRTQRFLLHHLADLKTPDKGKTYILDRLNHTLTAPAASGENLPEYENADHLADQNTQQMLDTLLNDGYRGGTMGGRTRLDIARRLRQKRQRVAQRDQIIIALDFLEEWGNINDTPAAAFEVIERFIPNSDPAAQRILREWKEVMNLLKSYDIPIESVRIQPDLARSWEYYTGLVFELRTASNIHLGGGGRYDDLTRLIGGQQAVPAVGFAYYMDQVIAALPSSAAPLPPPVTLAFDPHTSQQSVQWAHQLRLRGVHIRLMPADQITTNAPIITVDAQATAHLAGQSFTLSQIDELVSRLKRVPEA